MITDIKKFTATFDKIAHGKSQGSVFTDFLDMVICALSLGAYEEEYLLIVKKYKREEVDLFCELLAELLIIMDNDGAGLKDVLGEFYQLNLSNKKAGEFFTPPHVAELMAQMTMDETTRVKTIIDPCCGAGIMLLGAAKVNRDNYFFGADISHTSCKMCAINLCLNNLVGEVAWMNTLSGEHFSAYTIARTQAYPRVPIIRKLPANEGVIYNSAPFNRAQESQQEERKIITVTQAKLEL